MPVIIYSSVVPYLVTNVALNVDTFIYFQDYISSLNWTYRVQLRDKKVDYQNAYAEFVDNHTVKVSGSAGEELL